MKSSHQRLLWWAFFVWVIGVMGPPTFMFSVGILRGPAPQDADHSWFWIAGGAWLLWTLGGCAIMDHMDRQET